MPLKSHQKHPKKTNYLLKLRTIRSRKLPTSVKRNHQKKLGLRKWNQHPSQRLRSHLKTKLKSPHQKRESPKTSVEKESAKRRISSQMRKIKLFLSPQHRLPKMAKSRPKTSICSLRPRQKKSKLALILTVRLRQTTLMLAVRSVKSSKIKLLTQSTAILWKDPYRLSKRLPLSKRPKPPQMDRMTKSQASVTQMLSEYFC